MLVASLLLGIAAALSWPSLDARLASLEAHLQQHEKAHDASVTSHGNVAHDEVDSQATPGDVDFGNVDPAPLWKKTVAPVGKVGRTFLSADPYRSAEMMLWRVGGKFLHSAQDTSSSQGQHGYLTSTSNDCARIVSIELPKIFGYKRIQFIRDEHVKTGLVRNDPYRIMPDALHDWEVMVNEEHHGVDGEKTSAWLDNHDGYAPWTALNTTNMGNAPGGVYCSGNPRLGGWVLRGVIPAATPFQSWESAAGPLSPSDIEQLSANGCGPPPDNYDSGCRDVTVDMKYSNYCYATGWFKSTHQTNQPEDFVQLFADLMGAHLVPSPYGRGPTSKAECQIVVRWAYFNLEQPDGSTNCFMIHAVRSKSATGQDGGVVSSRTFSKSIIQHRNWTANGGEGVFDTWMYNSLVFSVAHLAPYKEKLNNMHHSYLERLIPASAGAPASCSLWIALPGTSYTLQLIAPEGCDHETATPFDTCSPK